jgi:hypothetical protein
VPKGDIAPPYDFFLKTEIDKTAIELYKAFKEHAPSMSSIPSISIEPTTTHYNDVRSWLNICELIAVGVNKGVFSKTVSEAYWGDVVPWSHRTAEELDRVLIKSACPLCHQWRRESGHRGRAELPPSHVRAASLDRAPQSSRALLTAFS